MAEPSELEKIFLPPDTTGKEEEEEEQQPTYSRPSTPVSPAPPPSADVDGAAPSALESIFLPPGQQKPQKPKEAPKERGNLTSYLGETFSDIGIELPESMQKLLGKDPQVPYIKVEKEYLSESLPEFASSASGKGFGGQQAIDLALIRSDLITAKKRLYIQNFNKSNGRAPTQQEYEAASVEIHNDTNREIYALAKKKRGQRPSALIGSSGAPNSIAWYDIDPAGKLHGGIGPVAFDGEDRNWFEKLVTPLALMAAGANHTIVADEVDKDGKKTGGYVMPVYNENHALGWLDWSGRISLFSQMAVAGKAGGADSPFDFLKPSLPTLALSEAVLPDSWINPVQKGYGTDEALSRQFRGEDHMSLASDLNLGMLMIPARTALWGQEKLGMISPETAAAGRAATDVVAGFGLALVDPDLLSVYTAGVGKVANARHLPKVMGALGDALGVSAASKATKQKETLNLAAENLVEIISTPDMSPDDLMQGMADSLGSFDRKTQILITNNARTRMGSDPKLSKISEDVIKNFEIQADKLIENKDLISRPLKDASESIRGLKKPAEEMGKVARGETKTLKKAAERIDDLKSAGKIEEAKTLASKTRGYRTMQLFNMTQATVLADLLAQKRAMGILRRTTRVARKTSSKGIPQLQKELGEVTKNIQLARQKMAAAFKETAGAAKEGGTKAFNEAQAEMDSAMLKWDKLALELSTTTSDEAEKVLDSLIISATRKLKQSDARLAKRTKEIDGLGYPFKVDPSEHKNMVQAIVKTAPKQMQAKITASVVATVMREMAAEAGKIAEFATETRPGGITGSTRKTLDEYAKLPRAMVRGADASAVEEAAGKAERVGRYYSDYVGVSGVNSKKELANELQNLDPEGSPYPTVLQVIDFMANRAESPEDRAIAKRLLETIVVDPTSRVYIVDKALIDKAAAGKSPFTYNGGVLPKELLPKELLPLGDKGDRALGMVAFRKTDTNFRVLNESIASAKVKIKKLNEAKKPTSLTRTDEKRDEELAEAIVDTMATWSGLRKQAEEYIEVFEASVKRGEDLTDGEKVVYKAFSELEDRLQMVELQYEKIMDQRDMAYAPNVSDGSVRKKYPLTTVVNMAGSALKKAEIDLSKVRYDFVNEGLGEYKLGPQDMFLATFDEYAGVNAETIIHELLHVATIEQIKVAEGMTEAQLNSTKFGKAVKNLKIIAKAASSQTDAYVIRLNDKSYRILGKAWEGLDKEYETLDRGAVTLGGILGGGNIPSDYPAMKDIVLNLFRVLDPVTKLRRSSVDTLTEKSLREAVVASPNIIELIAEARKGLGSLPDVQKAAVTKFLGEAEKLLPSINKSASDLIKWQSAKKIAHEAEMVYFKATLVNPARKGLSPENLENLDIYELITYGLTNQPYIDFLKTVKMPKGNKSLWSNFVRTVANLFGIKNENALSNLLQATDDLLTMSLDDVFEEAGAAAKTRYFESSRSKLPLMEKVRRFFSESAFRRAADKTEGNSRSVLVYLSPEEFLGLARKGIDPTKTKRVSTALRKGEKFSDIPFLNMDDTGKIIGHEGRHRMRALQAAGVEKVPVVLTSNNIRWSSQSPRFKGKLDYASSIPQKLKAEDGDYTIDIPIYTEGPNRGKFIQEAPTEIGSVSQKVDLPLNPSEFSREQEIYLLRQLDLMSDYKTKETMGLPEKILDNILRSGKAMIDPATAKLATSSEDLQNIGISTFTDIKGMQADLVRNVGRTARKAGKAAVKAAQKAGELKELKGRELASKKVEIRDKAEAAVFVEYMTSPETVGGSKYNTIFSGKSLWTQAKPMLRATLGKKGERTKAFTTLAKMWMTNIPRNDKELANLYSHVENLLRYGHVDGKKGLEKRLINEKVLKKGEELTEEQAQHFGNKLEFEEFSDAVRTLTASPYRQAGLGSADLNTKKVMAYAAQAVAQMAALNHASTRVNGLVSEFSEEAVLAASRIVGGLSNDPGADLEKAIDLMNKLRIPAYVRRAATDANKYLKVGIELYSDPNSQFKAILPSEWMQATSQRLSKVEKIIGEAYFTTANPMDKFLLRTVQGFYRIWQTSILTGLFVPRSAYWTAIYIGNIAQVFSEGRPLEAGKLALSPVRDVVWASQRLINQTPLGKYVDDALDYTANKFGTKFPLASITNALVNKNVNQLMDPRLAPNDTKIAGTDYTLGDMRRFAFEQRIFQSFASSTKLANLVKRAGRGQKMEKLKDALAAPMEFWADFADTIDQRQRVALFTDLVINRGLSPEEAGKITREALYDWDAPLSSMEAQVLQKVFMFWNFQRRAMGQGMRILLDPYIKGKDDSLTDIMLKSSPVLAAVTGKEAYKTSYLMAMEEMLKQTKYLMIEKGEVQPDGSVEGGTDPAYPSWGTKATNKIFLPNVPMSPDRGANYTNSIGKKPGSPDITHKVLTMPSFTPIEMVNNWADILGVMTAYGVSWAEMPANVMRGKGFSEGVGASDVGDTLFKHLLQMGGPVSEKTLEALGRDWGFNDREAYQRGGVPVRRLSDKKILQALDALGLGGESGLIYRDLEMEGDAYRTTPGVLRAYRMIPGLSNEISTLFEPFLNNSAEGAEVQEALGEWFFNFLGFKTYRYSPEYVKQQDVKDIKKKTSLRRREMERQTGIKKR